MMSLPFANTFLGYPPDARLLIINADDFGMCHAINQAIQQTLTAGVVQSTTLMVPCPWALHAMRFLSEHPEIPFGIHLTVISDPQDYRWGPLTPIDKVPSLVNPDGYFRMFDEMPQLRAQARINELELEFRAQIEKVLHAGLHPTHLDWHALRFEDRTDIVHLMIRLAKEYGLALRVIGRPVIESLHKQGLPCIDHVFLDSYNIAPADKSASYARLLHELPAGLSEWAVHPGLDTLELRAVDPGGYVHRHTDLAFWTSPQAADLIQKEGILLINYRQLQSAWKAGCA